MNSKETKMNTEVHFSCSNGNSLLGPNFVVCLPSGNWSAPLPTCESKFTMITYILALKLTETEK